MEKVDSIIERYRDEKTPIEKFELSDTSFSEEIFPLFDKWLHIALQSGVKDIIFRVPRLILERCHGLEKIELLNLQRIKSVTIKTSTNQHIKIEAPTLEHLYYFSAGEGYPMLDIINAPNLVSLECRGEKIPKIFVDANLQWNCHPRKSSSHESKPSCNKLQEVTTYKFDWEKQNWHLSLNLEMHCFICKSY
ncbi:hypothetical protein H5410_047961 [Solanum commersonii]|uniref:Uncharacterized protein n=1 Tax=Solanum commersonii TaxID=4109 RepID=A0A9J5XIX3_SOLCO|nr:hypothetical protein H5410_047961 [Solanum commersonii]